MYKHIFHIETLFVIQANLYNKKFITLSFPLSLFPYWKMSSSQNVIITRYLQLMYSIHFWWSAQDVLETKSWLLHQRIKHNVSHLKNYFIIWNYVSVFLHVGFVYTRTGWRPEALDPLKLELKVFVSCLTWMLGNKLRSSARVEHALNHWLISPTLSYV